MQNIFSLVSSIQWQGRECGQDSQATIYEVYESGQSEYLVLLDWWTSPPQCLLSRRCTTLLPITGSLLHSSYPTEEDTGAINSQKLHQKFYYNRQVKHLKPIVPGETISMWLPGESTWNTSICTGLVAQEVMSSKSKRSYRRNRHQIIQAD